MVLLAVRGEAGPVGPKPSGGQRRSRGELENSSRQPRDLTKLGQKAAPRKYLTTKKKALLTLSRGMVMRGVPDDEDEVRPIIVTSPCGSK
jgi:hypothetical protein